MKGFRSQAGLCVVVSLALLAVPASAQIARIRHGLTLKPMQKPVLSPQVRDQEMRLLAEWRLSAKPLEPGRVLASFPVVKLDYSDAVTFQRNQDGWGGCFHYAALHVMDILNEWRSPYTPDLSFRYLEYMGTVRFNQSQERPQQWTLNEDGVCSEAMLHTNYDRSKLVGTGKDADKDGNEDQTWDHVLFQGDTPKPTPANDAEAKRYRVNMSIDYAPSVATIKTLLCEYGPVWASGQFHYSLGIGYGEGHVVAIVGFDDTQRQFKCLNSWGPRRSADGYFVLTYEDAEKVWHTQDSKGKNVSSPELWSVRVIEGGVGDRSAGPEAYSARIRLQSDGRNSLTISVGVVGQQPLVVWDRPNRVNLKDRSGDLVIDVPLPAYAADHWPPKAGPHPWYVKVEDGDDDDRWTKIMGVTLAREYRNPNCKSIGAIQTETHDATTLPPGIPDKGDNTAYIPSSPEQSAPIKLPSGILRQRPGGVATPRLPISRRPVATDALHRVQLAQRVDLSASNPNVLPGQTVTLTATVAGGNSAAGKEVTFYWVHAPKVAYRNKPEEYSVLGKALTGPDGRANLTLKSDFASRAFAAALVEPDGRIAASSGKLTIGQVVK